MDPAVSTRTELQAVRVRRAELRENIDAMERALASPARGRAVVWGEAVHASLVVVADDFSAHVEVTEGPGGLHQAILSGDLRLANAVDALTAEHGQIAEEIAGLVADSAPPVTPDDVAGLRERANRLLGHLIRHRQQGADLIYEAFETDIGGGD
ncbi:MAG: hypothetical protein ABR571_17795 [Jatrophihabitans sp.]|uniref:hypothetical protein n=1 Tax=Jatrophihabitans sp. TaxID=1932789 RepID=UPI00391318A4